MPTRSRACTGRARTSSGSAPATSSRPRSAASGGRCSPPTTMYTAALFDQAGIPVAAGRRLGGEQRVRLRDHLAGDGRRDAAAGPRPWPARPSGRSCRATCRSARTRTGPTQALATAVRFMKEGGARGQARRRAPRRRPDPGPHQARHPRHGATSDSRRRASTPSAATGCRAATTRPTEVDRRRARRRRGRRVRRGAGDGPRRGGRRDHQASCPSRRWASAPGPTRTRRCSSGRTWPGCARGQAPRFVKRYAEVADVIQDAARAFADEVRAGEFPTKAHSFD